MVFLSKKLIIAVTLTGKSNNKKGV